MWRERPSPQTGENELVEMYFDQVPSLLASNEDEVEMVAFGPPVPYKKSWRISRKRERKPGPTFPSGSILTRV
jgi:hypothetical protein